MKQITISVKPDVSAEFILTLDDDAPDQETVDKLLGNADFQARIVDALIDDVRDWVIWDRKADIYGPETDIGGIEIEDDELAGYLLNR